MKSVVEKVSVIKRVPVVETVRQRNPFYDELIIGIDPGKHGAMAVIQSNQLVYVLPFQGDIARCREVSKFVGTTFIETVTASPQMGVVSAFTFGRYAESVETAAYLSGSVVKKVRPAVWQNAIGCFTQGDKNVVYDKMKEMFSAQYKRGMFNKSSADAVGVAVYGLQVISPKRQ